MARPYSGSTDELVARLDDDGFVVVPSLLDDDTVDDLRGAFGPQTDGSTLHVEVTAALPTADRWCTLDDHPVIATLLADTLGTYSLRTHGREPGRGAGAQGLHADLPPSTRAGFDALTVIWMLDDFTESNGSTRVVPRSHLGAAAVPRHLAQPDVTHPDEVVVTGTTGDVLVFDAHLWHSGTRNRTGERRRAVQMTATRAR